MANRNNIGLEYAKRKAEEQAKKTEKTSSTKSGGGKTNIGLEYAKRKATESPKTNTTQRITDYSSAVKYLNDKGFKGAAGMMTESEWHRRSKSGNYGNTYQDYLDKTIDSYSPVTFSVEVDGNKREFGGVSKGAFEAIQGNTLDKYIPKTESEKKVIDSYKTFADEYALPNSAKYNETIDLIKRLEDAKSRTTEAYYEKRVREETERLQREHPNDYTTPFEAQADDIAYQEFKAAEKEVEELTKQFDRLKSGAREANLYDSTIGAVKRGYYNMVSGKQSFEEMEGRANESEKYKELLASDEYNTYTDNKAQQALQFIGELLGQQVYYLTDPRPVGGAFAGGGTAFIAGQAAPIPEELISIPAAMKAGYAAGAAAVTYETSAGHTYAMLKDLGVSDEVARNASHGVGFGVGLLEAMQLDELVDAYVVGITNGATDDVLKVLASEIIKRTKNTATETTEEVLQELVSIGGEKLAYRIDKGENLYTADEVKDRLNETATTSLIGFGAMNVPATAINTTRTVVNNKNKAKNAVADMVKTDKEIVTALVEEGKAMGGNSATIATKIENTIKKGNEVSTRQVRKLLEANEAQKTSSPTTLEEAAQQAVQNRQRKNPAQMLDSLKRGEMTAEILDALTKDNVQITAEEVKKVTGLGDKGSELIAKLANRDGVTFSQAEQAVKTAYNVGFSNISSVKVNFANNLQKAAFDAGKVDRGAQDRIALENAQKAAVYDGAFTENEHTKNYTDAEKKMISIFAKGLRMDINAVDEIIANTTFDETGNEVKHYANASHVNGQMEISSGARNILYKMVLHEGGHRMRQLAPAEFGVLMNALYDRAVRRGLKSGASPNAAFDYVKAEHDNAGITKNTSGYIEELAVRELETIFSSAEEFNKWYAEISSNQQAKTAWEKFVDWISKVFEDIKQALELSKLTKEERAKAKNAIAELEHIKELYANAIKAAENAATARANEVQAKQNAEDTITKETKKGAVVNGNVLSKESIFADTKIEPQAKMSSVEDAYQKVQEGASHSLKTPSITQKHIEVLRSIGRKNIFNFTSADIEKAEVFARRMWETLGTKSPFFRAWFGDWRAGDIHNKVKIAEIPEYIGTNEGRKKNRGIVRNEDTGWNINISREGETNTISHSGRNRMSEFGLAGIRELLENAILLDSEVHEHHTNNVKIDLISFDHKLYALGESTEGTVGLYKITVEEYFQSKSEPENKRFHNLRYIEKVADVGGRTYEETRSGGSTNDNSATTYSIADLHSFVKKYDTEFKPKESSKVVNKDGTPKVLYHQTENIFTVFDTRHEGAGTRDHETPFGIFLKPTNEKIGVKGDVQMPLYANIRNLLEVANRNDLVAVLKEMSSEFSRLYEEHVKLDKEYQSKFDEAQKSFRDYIIKWRAENPDASRQAIYNDPEFTQVFDAEENVLEEWENNARELEIKTKDVITKILKKNKYDGVHLLEDVGGFGKKTETYIVLEPTQVKSATGNIGTFDNGNKDVNFSLKEEKPANILANKTKEGYNGNTSYSLRNWRTDLNATQFKQVEKWIRQAGKPEATRITDTANWYKGRINGEDLFVIYSTETNDPTILYERKGEGAKAELDTLQRILEVIENGESVIGKQRNIDRLFSGDWVQKKHNMANNDAGPGGRGSNTGYASVLQGKPPKFIGSKAFRNVVKNLFDIQERSGNNGRLSEGASNSLKGGMSATELFDTVDNAKKGKKAAVDKLDKYVESGAISTKLYNELLGKYGAIPSGEKPYRDVQVPKKTAKNKKVSQTVRTILEAEVTPDEAVPTIEKMVEDGIFSYEAYTDKEAISNAEARLKKHGWVQALNKWLSDVESGRVSKDITTTGWALYNNAANTAATTTDEQTRKDAVQTSLIILDAMAKHQRSAAQALQATRILKKLSPETQLYGVQQSVQAFQNKLNDRYGKRAPDLKIDEELAEKFLNAKTEDERLEAEIEIYKDIGRQMPASWLEKWNAWRYVAMLSNLRTHGRNSLGNAFFAPVVLTKDLTATAIESIVNRVSTKKIVRGKALITGSKADRKLLKAAWGDYANVADLIDNGGKYNDSALANKHIEEGRRIFKNKFLEWLRRKNSELLGREDMWFSKPHYAYALAQYCKANNITAEQIKRGKAIAPAREYAIKEAQKATYKDTNAFSQFVSSLGRSGNSDNAIKKVAKTVIEGILPFRKTPANILVRGVEYSPLGLLKSLTYDLRQVSKGEMTATEAIDNISAGLTGTGLLALGVYLAAQGLIRGHGEEEKEEKEFSEMMGHQAYALELPNGESITLDWLAPEALPFFVGVNIWETANGPDKEVNLSSTLKAVSNISEPMLEMSCLQGLNDLVEGVGYASSNDTSGLISILSSAATSYLTQGIPTLFGQAERTGEENRMTTYTEKNDFLTSDMQYTLGKISSKIPFWDYHQIPYIDAWGRKEASGVALKRGFNNFLNPAYTSTIADSYMEKELLRLYEQTGEGGVFPSRADKYFTVDGVRKDLTADEYVRYATLKGEKSYKLVSELVHSEAYKKLSDAEKAKAVSEVYDYANQKAKQAISNYKPQSWVTKADEFGENVGNYISFKTEVSGAKEENGGKISRQEVADIILDTAQNDIEVWEMYLSMYESTGANYARDNGVDGEVYMHFIEALNKYDQPTKNGTYGTYTQAEVKKAINSLRGLSRKEKNALYKSINTKWGNPY